MLVGRESEISQMEEVLREGKSALVVVSSKPGMGRSALLDELRSRAKNRNWRILPVVSKEEASPGTIAINRDTTEVDFRNKVVFAPHIDIQADDARIQAISPYPSSAAPESAKDETVKRAASIVSVQSVDTVFNPQDIQEGALQARTDVFTPSGKPEPKTEVDHMLSGTLILIDSYQPDNQFETWFLRQYIPETRRAIPPVVMFVAGYSRDLVALSESADRRIELGPLPVQATTDYFRNLNHHIEDNMVDKEIQTYAKASAGDPSLIDALTRLLQLK
jgi:hypothetical protein